MSKKRSVAELVNIITKAQKANNLSVINTCAVGLHLISIEHKYKDGGGGIGYSGYWTLVCNGHTVSYDSDDIEQPLTELDNENFILERIDEEIPPAFLPKDLFEQALFNSWRQ